MGKIIDCFFIGHNEMDFSDYEKKVRSMGLHSGAYRDLNLGFLMYQGKPATVPELFNALYQNKGDGMGLFSLGNTFSGAIAYLGTYLHRNGLTFDYVNSFRDEKERLIRSLREEQIRVIAIPTTLYVAPFPIIEIMAFIKQHNQSAKVVLGGPFIATQVKSQDQITIQNLFKLLKADFYVNSSQGEHTLVQLIQALKNDLPVDSVPNIFYPNGAKFQATGVDLEDNSLDANPVEWGLFADRLGKIASVRTSRSCPFSCSFCAFPDHAGKHQVAAVETIERELDALNSVSKVGSVNIIDDTFNIPPTRFKEIMKMMIKKRYRFKWNSSFRCQFADEEMVKLMKESNCEGVLLGLESGNQGMLDNMNKKVNLDQYKRGLELLHKYDILTYASFIIGFPGETDASVNDTFEFVEKYQPSFFRPLLWYCDPATPIWKQKDQYQLKGSQFSWSHRTMNSETACNLIDEIFLKVKNSIWIPQHTFEYYGVFNLMQRGFTLSQVKDFVRAFNEGVKEKLLNSDPFRESPQAIEKMRHILN